MTDTVTIAYLRTRIQTMIEELQVVHNQNISHSDTNCQAGHPITAIELSARALAYHDAITRLQQWLADLDKLEAHNNDTEQHAYNVGTRVETTLGPGKIEGLAQDGGYWVHLQKEGTTPHIDPEFLRPYIPTKTRGGIGSGLFGEPEPLEEVDDE